MRNIIHKHATEYEAAYGGIVDKIKAPNPDVNTRTIDFEKDVLKLTSETEGYN